MTKQEAIELLQSIEVTYNHEDTYREILDAVWEIDDKLANEGYRADLYDLLMEENIYDADDSIIEDIVAREVADGGLERLYYFLGDWTPNSTLVRIDAYGNLTSVDTERLEILIDDLIYAVELLD